MRSFLVASTLASASALTMPTVARRACAPRMALDGEQELLARFGLPVEELKTDRRSALGLLAAGAATAAMVGPAQAADGPFSVPPLPYAYDALEPHIDAATMKVRSHRFKMITSHAIPSSRGPF